MCEMQLTLNLEEYREPSFCCDICSNYYSSIHNIKQYKICTVCLDEIAMKRIFKSIPKKKFIEMRVESIITNYQEELLSENEDESIEDINHLFEDSDKQEDDDISEISLFSDYETESE